MKKDNKIDLIRVIAMILVIIIHVSNYYCRSYLNISLSSYIGGTLFNSLARICVPLFFMISGSLLIKQDFNLNKYYQRIKKFIVILIVWNLFYLLWNKFYLNHDINTLKSLITMIFIPIKAHLWYIYALLGLYIIMPFIQVMIKNLDEQKENLLLKLWLFFSGVVYILRLILFGLGINTVITYPVPLVQCTYYLGYFIAGYILYNRIKATKNDYTKSAIYLFLTSTIITWLGTVIISSLSNNYFEQLFAYRSIFIIIASLSVFYLIINSKFKLENRNLKIIEKLSFVSLGVYLIHPVFLDIIKVNIKMLNINAFIGVPIFSIIILAFSWLTVCLLKKVKYIKNII